MLNNTTPACPDVRGEESIIGSLSALGAGVVGFLTSFLITNREAIAKWMMSKLGKKTPTSSQEESQDNHELDRKNLDVIVDGEERQTKPIKIKVRSRGNSVDGEMKPSISITTIPDKNGAYQIEISDDNPPERGRAKKRQEDKEVRFRRKSAPPLSRRHAEDLSDKKVTSHRKRVDSRKQKDKNKERDHS